MATVTHRLSHQSNVDASSYVSAAFTPAAGELLVVVVDATGHITPDATELTSSDGLTFTRVQSTLRATSAHRQALYVSNQTANAVSQTVTYNCVADPATGVVIFVAGVSGMSRVGAAAVKQSAALSNQAAAVTLAVTLPGACTGTNPVVGSMGTQLNPPGVTPPASFTEGSDLGHTSPTAGAEYAFRSTGQTGTTITWGSNSGSGWGAIVVELDASSSGTTHVTTTWASSYKVRTHLTTTWASSYKVRTHLTTTWQSSYKVRDRLTTTWQSSYKVRDRLTTTWQSSYKIRDHVTTTWASSYKVKDHVTTTWSSAYAVQGAAVHITTTWASSYRVRDRLTTTWTSSYKVRDHQTVTWASSYKVRERLTTLWTSSYSVRERVQVTWASLYEVRVHRSATWTSSYSVQGHVTTTWSSSYVIITLVPREERLRLTIRMMPASRLHVDEKVTGLRTQHEIETLEVEE